MVYGELLKAIGKLSIMYSSSIHKLWYSHKIENVASERMRILSRNMETSRKRGKARCRGLHVLPFHLKEMARIFAHAGRT